MDSIHDWRDEGMGVGKPRAIQNVAVQITASDHTTVMQFCKTITTDFKIKSFTQCDSGFSHHSSLHTLPGAVSYYIS